MMRGGVASFVVILTGLTGVLILALLYGAIAWAAVHFILKFW